MSSEIESKIKDIVAQQLSVPADQVTLEATFKDDLGADSLDIVELVMALEEELEIDIPDEEANKILTVGDAVTYVKAKKGL